MSSGQMFEVEAATAGVESYRQSWYAVQTRARHEKVVAERLRYAGVETFLPLITEVHRWSDRRKTVELPLFTCYVFVRLAPSNEERLRVRQIDGVVNFVGVHGQGVAIPNEQIDAVQTILAGKLSPLVCPFLKAGQRVRIRGGALDGVEGIFQTRNGDQTLVISVDAIQRSLSVRIEG